MVQANVKPVGLTEKEVLASRERHGANVITAVKRRGFWRHFLANLGDPVIKVLLAALAVNLLFILRTHEWFETVGIALSVFLATLISTVSEYGSEAAFARLCEACGATFCRVRRGAVREIEVCDVVAGDIVLLTAGEKIPADGVLISGELSVDQAALTGESREVEKCPTGGENDLGPNSKSGLLAGSVVVSGEGEMQVLSVGDATYLGGISHELQVEVRDSPLKARLATLAHQISRIGYAAAGVCVLAFLFHALVIDNGFSGAEILARVRDLPYILELLLHALMLGLTVVVVAVPEGLPMMIAVVLSSNMRRMTRDRVLVRKPAGLEAAGSMNILFTDKTGTLTTGKLSLSRILTARGSYSGYRTLAENEGALAECLALAAVCNNSAVRGERDGRAVALGGNSTDRALLTAFLSAPVGSFSVRRRVPFDSARKYTAAELEGGRVFVTGAPEKLLPHLVGARGAAGVSRVAFAERICARTQMGERVILLCEGQKFPERGLDGGLVLLAALSFSDPLRPEAREAVETLGRAGVQVVMMTGDSKETATRIARDCGILSGERVCLDGRELAAMGDAELGEILPRLGVIARALPADKSRLVRLCEERGLVVGMTGDGINDAPALHSADVGFAMGSGTQVAKEAGDVVILDDNLASICRAVLYGRTIFKSIRKFITLQLVMNFCAVGISIIGPFIGFNAPVTVVQMLWINLVMDTLGGLAFAGEAPMLHYMKEPPKRRDEPILTRAIAGRIATLCAVTVSLLVLFLKLPWLRSFYRESADDAVLLTAFFALFIFSGVFNCFNARTDRVQMLSGLLKNRAFVAVMAAVAAVQILFVYLGGAVLRTVPLTGRELAVTLLLALLVLPLGWLGLVRRRLRAKGGLY